MLQFGHIGIGGIFYAQMRASCVELNEMLIQIRHRLQEVRQAVFDVVVIGTSNLCPGQRFHMIHPFETKFLHSLYNTLYNVMVCIISYCTEGVKGFAAALVNIFEDRGTVERAGAKCCS